MFIDMTEAELEERFHYMGSREIIEFLVEAGLELNEEKLEAPQGVYRRKEGMDVIEYDGFRWRTFNPDTRSEDIVWTLSRSGREWWTMVLTPTYRPVAEGAEILVDNSGKILKIA